MNDFPNRPDHADFWLMAECVQDLDTAADDGVGLERIVGRSVDPESLKYVAAQRALRAKMALRTNPLTGATPVMTEAMLGAVWIDAFSAGMLFERRRQERGK